MHYIAARLRRDGFERLAINVECRKLSARFAKELAATVPSEHLDAVTEKGTRWTASPYLMGLAICLDLEGRRRQPLDRRRIEAILW